MRKFFGGAIIVLVSIVLIAVMAHLGNQRQAAQLEAQASAYTDRTPVKRSASAASDTVKSSSSSSKIKERRKVTYVAVGDDIAAGHYTTTAKASYQYLVAAYLQKQLGFTVTMSNFAKSGATIGTSGLPNVGSIVAKKPDLVTIQYGNNEQTATGSTASLYQTNLTKLVRDLQAKLPKAKIILLTPWTQNAAFKRAAVAAGKTTGAPIVDLSPIQTAADTSAKPGTRSWSGPVSGDWPNDNGNAKIAGAINQAVSQLYK